MNSYCFIFGTRPEIIKLAPLIRHVQSQKRKFWIIHTNQHYDRQMDEIFFHELTIPPPDIRLSVDTTNTATQIGEMISLIGKHLDKIRPSWVIVQGDTNSGLAGALAAVKNNIKVAHIEAGLRSYDKDMPEEINRIAIDQMSNLLFCPTNTQKINLQKEGLSTKQIKVVGNTVVDAVNANLKLADKSSILKKLDIEGRNYSLMTLHRPSNVDFPDQLSKILKMCSMLASKKSTEIIFPIHHRTKKNLELSGIKIPELIRVIDPLGYFDFLKLQYSAKFILTDSGGIQEEACIMGIPCITLRKNTERPETLTIGSNMLIKKYNQQSISKMQTLLSGKRQWRNPYGNGKTSINIYNILENNV